jgi:hypothetical protein
MKTDGIKRMAISIGYRYLSFSLEILPITNESKNVAIIIRRTIPIASVGSANNGNI